MNIENKTNSIEVTESINFNKKDFINDNILSQIDLDSKNVNGIYLYLKDELRYGINSPLYKHEKLDFWIKIKKNSSNFYWVIFIPSKYDDVLNVEIILYKSPIIENINQLKDGPINHQYWIPNWVTDLNKIVPNIKINRVLEINKNINNYLVENILVEISKPLHKNINLDNPIEGVYTNIDSNIYVNTKNHNYLIINDNELKEWKLVKIDKDFNILGVFFYFSYQNSLINKYQYIPLYLWTQKIVEKNSEGIDQYEIPLLNFININGYQTINISKFH